MESKSSYYKKMKDCCQSIEDKLLMSSLMGKNTFDKIDKFIHDIHFKMEYFARTENKYQKYAQNKSDWNNYMPPFRLSYEYFRLLEFFVVRKKISFSNEIKIRSYFGPSLKPFINYTTAEFDSYRKERYSKEYRVFEKQAASEAVSWGILIKKNRYEHMNIRNNLTPLITQLLQHIDINNLALMIDIMKKVPKYYKECKSYARHIGKMYYLYRHVDKKDYEEELNDKIKKAFQQLDMRYHIFCLEVRKHVIKLRSIEKTLKISPLPFKEKNH